MRTTLSIDDDVLAAARDIARAEGSAIGSVLSRLARRALAGNAADGAPTSPDDEFFGFRPLPRRGVIVTNDLVNAIREEEGV
ncbi:MAG: hypothetical protein LBG60_05790 [Bifidobacteriaceae bacterium]|jgi:hypothetical protein|nr:hypothetical protein [Bifidobacteriaceae bacterium]